MSFWNLPPLVVAAAAMISMAFAGVVPPDEVTNLLFRCALFTAV